MIVMVTIAAHTQKTQYESRWTLMRERETLSEYNRIDMVSNDVQFIYRNTLPFGFFYQPILRVDVTFSPFIVHVRFFSLFIQMMRMISISN